MNPSGRRVINWKHHLARTWHSAMIPVAFQEMSMSGRFRVLAIDGGGVRGIVPAMVLHELEQEARAPISSLFDLIVGTSTGGILALGLVAPKFDEEGHWTPAPRFSAADLVGFYQEETKKIFEDRTVAGRLWREAKYAGDELEKSLRRYFQDTALGEAIKPVILTSYCTEHRRLVLFKSRKAVAREHRNVAMWMAARASSAAPTYFPPFQMNVAPAAGVKTNFSLIDGGLVANNPSMCGLYEARRHHQQAEVMLVSLGTGIERRPIHYRDIKDAGPIGWVGNILDILFSGAAEAADNFAAEFVTSADIGTGRNYFRFQVDLAGAQGELDDYRRVGDLQKLAANKIKERSPELKLLAKSLMGFSPPIPTPLKGTVSSFDKGYGKIDTEVGTVFVHHTAIEGAGRKLSSGQQVELAVIRLRDGRLRATCVRPLSATEAA